MLGNSTTTPGSLERAIEIAVAAHAGVTDKAGEPYVLHPLRVMLAMEGEAARIVGVLHDVVEDAAEWDFQRLQGEGFDDAVIAALRAVTKLPSEEDQPGDSPALKLKRYLNFIQRAARHPLGRLVKLADLNDNLDASRLGVASERDLWRMSKYRAARDLLLSLS